MSRYPIGTDPLNRPQRCTYYADLTVRETGTGPSGTGPAYLMASKTSVFAS